MSEANQLEEDAAIVRRHVSQLMEHFDSVRIFATKMVPADDGLRTASFTWGGGNCFAQVGLVDEWLLKQRERSKVELHREYEVDDDEEVEEVQ